MNDEERNHLEQLLDTHRRRLDILSEDWKFVGGDLPTYKRLEIDDAVKNIAIIEAQLQLKQTSHDFFVKPDVPYVGMEPFSSEQAASFFGRNQEIEELIRKLSIGRFRVVIGQSGCGKSSLVRAGLIPEITRRRDLGQGPWLIRILRPREIVPEELRPLFNASSEQLPSSVQQLLTSQGAEQMLLVVDQYEEIFATPPEQQAEAEHFQMTLVQLASIPHCYVVLTVRADFYGQLIDSPIRAEMERALHPLAAITDEGLRLAIKEPATKLGVVVEDALVERIVADASGDAGALPLIQAMLVLLWNDWQRLKYKAWRITLDDYLRFGKGSGKNGLQVAIQVRAEDAYKILPNVQAKTIAQRIFVRLVEERPGQIAIRRQLPIDALRATSDDPKVFDDTLQHFASKEWRLITVGTREELSGKRQEVAEIVHDAVITAWPTLTKWLDHLRSDEAIRQRQNAKVEEWIALNREGAWLDRVELSEADRWLKTPGATVVSYHPEFPAFVEASRARVEAADRAEAATKRTLRRRAVAFAGAATLALIAAVFSGILYGQANRNALVAETRAEEARTAQQLAEQRQQEAEQQKRVAGAQALAALAKSEIPNDAERSILLSMEAISSTHSLGEPIVREAEESLHQSLLASQLRVSLRGHNDMVFTAAYSPDGKNIVTASLDGSARLWDAQTGQTIQTFIGHNYSLNDVTYSSDNQMVAAVGEGGSARIWEVETKKEIVNLNQVLRLPEGSRVNGVAFSPDNQYVVVGLFASQPNVWVYNLKDPTATMSLEGHAAGVFNVAYSPDGRYIVTAGADNNAKIWDAKTGEILQTLQGHTDRVISANYSSDGKWIVTASWDKTVKLWDVSTGKELKTLTGHTDRVRVARFNLDNTRILSTGWDKTTIIWNSETDQPLQVLQGHDEKITKAIYSSDGRTILTVDEAGILKAWDASDGREVQSIQISKDAVRGLAYRPDGKQFATADDNGQVRFWDSSSYKVMDGILSISTGVQSAAFSPNGQKIVTAGRDGTARIWDVASGQILQTLRGHTSWVMSASFSPDGKIIVTNGQGSDGTVKLWEVDTGKLLLTANANTVGILFPQFSPDGRSIISSLVRSDTEKKWLDLTTVWDVATGTVIKTFETTRVGGRSTFSPDGRFVAVPLDDGSTSIWDVAAGVKVRSLFRHKGSVFGAFYSPDGKFIATASVDGGPKIWDANTGELLRTLTGGGLGVFTTVFSPDGQHLVTAHLDRVARIWNARLGDEGLTTDARDSYNEDATSFSDKGIFIDDSVGYSPDGTKVAAADSQHNKMYVWDANTGKRVMTLSGDTDTEKFGLMTAAFSPDGRDIMGSSSSNTIIVWDIATQRKRLRLMGLRASYCPDGRIVASTDDNKGARLWNGQTGDLLATFDGRGLTDAGVINVACSPINDEVATISGAADSNNQKLIIWDTSTGRPKNTIQLPEIALNVRYSPNGKFLLTSSVSGQVRIWNVETQKVQQILIGHTGFVSFAVWSQDGKSIVTWGSDATLRLWDAETGKVRFILDNQPAAVSAAFSPDSKYVFVAYYQGFLRRYVVSIDILLQLAKDRTTRELTPEEKEQFLVEPARN